MKDTLSDTFQIHGAGMQMTAMYIAIAESMGIPIAKLRGQSPHNSFLYYNGCQMLFSPKVHRRLMIDLMKFCSLNMPFWSTPTVAGYAVSEAGGSSIQELAYL